MKGKFCIGDLPESLREEGLRLSSEEHTRLTLAVETMDRLLSLLLYRCVTCATLQTRCEPCIEVKRYLLDLRVDLARIEREKMEFSLRVNAAVAGKPEKMDA